MFKKKLMLIVILLALILSTWQASWAQELASAGLTVTASIPAIQEISVIESANISFSYPQRGFKELQPLIFTDIGKISVESNSEWALMVNVFQSGKFKVWIRPTGRRFSEWGLVSNSPLVYRGAPGVQQLSWDVKIEKDPGLICEVAAENIELVFTSSLGF